MSLIDFTEQPQGNPLEVVERVAASNGWSFERAGDDEITILVTGKWTDYQVSYTWMFDIEALHLACAFELKVPERCRGEVQQLISLINAQMWVGHFDLWTQDGLVMYRHALVLAGGVEASSRQCEALLATALGLLAAIPAVIAFNKLSNSAGRIGQRLEGFADEFSAILSRQIDERMALAA